MSWRDRRTAESENEGDTKNEDWNLQDREDRSKCGIENFNKNDAIGFVNCSAG